MYNINMIGGNIDQQGIFKHILSIGYEFETHDLAKLSETDSVLMNSNITLKILENKIENEEAYPLDNNQFMINIGSKEEYEYDDDNNTYVESEYSKNRDKEEEEEEEEEKEEQIKTYVEYVAEPDMDGDTVHNETMFNITNDIGDSDFIHMLKKSCTPIEDTVLKNDMYIFKTNNKEYKLNFEETLQNNCYVISGCEWIITFYKPKLSKNIILETFLNASKRILEHLHKLKKHPGQLFMIDSNGEKTQIGHMDKRILYQKPNTNLFYLQTQDNIKSKSGSRSNISKVTLVPQMTYRVHISNNIKVMKGMLHNLVDNMDKAKKKKKGIMLEYNTISKIAECVHQLLKEYNTTTNTKFKIPLKKKIGKNITNYLFLILYKLHIYVDEYSKTGMMNVSENYFKNYLTFSSRHTNDILYNRIKELLIEYFEPIFEENISEEKKNEKVVGIFLRIVYQPNILKKYMYLTKARAKALMNRKPKDADYGNPLVSFISYFDFFENPIITEDTEIENIAYDWLEYAKIDGLNSTQYHLKGDDVIIENRLFAVELSTLMNDYGVYASNSFLKIKQIQNFYDLMVHKKNKVKEQYNKILNPNTNRFVNKCNVGYTRNNKFKCNRTKTQNKTKKLKQK